MRENKTRWPKNINPVLYTTGHKLKDMPYSVEELSEALQIKPRYIREHLIGRMGAPYTQIGVRGPITINGEELYRWAKEFHEEKEMKKAANPLAEDEFYCVRCRARVVPESSELIIMKNGTLTKTAKCPVCGSCINKIVKRRID